MATNKQLLKKFIEESILKEYGGVETKKFGDDLKTAKRVAGDHPNLKSKPPASAKSIKPDDKFAKDLETGNFQSLALGEDEVADRRRGSSRLGNADDPSELTPEKMAQQSKLEPGDRGIHKTAGSSLDMRSGGRLDPAFMNAAGQLAMHPQVGKWLDKKFGADNVSKLLKWAKASHTADLKKPNTVAKGNFKNDFGAIVVDRMDLLDQHLGQGVAENIMDALFQLYQKKYKNLPRH